LLVEAAREAGAEVRERFTVDGLVIEDGCVTGIRGREGHGATLAEQATLVVGADGRHSLVAREVAARAYHATVASSVAYYTYWSDVRLDAGEMVARDRRLIGLWPTNDGLVISYVAAPADEFDGFRADPEGSILGALDGARDLGQRVRAGARADRVYGTADLASRFHEAHGPGWALVGDAGVVMDPVTGQGIAHALRDAEWLADAISTGLGGPGPLDAALADHQARRDAALLPMYRFTADLASFAPPSVAQTLLMEALARRPAEVDRFLGVLSGATPIPEYFSPRNLLRLLGMRGMIRAAMGQRREAAA
jgi:2-polyprenyl-6-methoxyphenol hydroxylase-like FAD-dependent oxidoreductase